MNEDFECGAKPLNGWSTVVFFLVFPVILAVLMFGTVEQSVKALCWLPARRRR